MSTRFYRLTVIGSALSWFLLGMHLPAAHAMAFELVHHGQAPSWVVLSLTSLFLVAAGASLWQLLRARAPR
jgi:hypothetical protein